MINSFFLNFILTNRKVSDKVIRYNKAEQCVLTCGVSSGMGQYRKDTFFHESFRCIVRDGAFCPRFVFSQLFVILEVRNHQQQGTTDQRRDPIRNFVLSTRTVLSWALCQPARLLIKRLKKILTWLRFPYGENRRSAKSWTTGNTALNRPSGKGSQKESAYCRY